MNSDEHLSILNQDVYGNPTDSTNRNLIDTSILRQNVHGKVEQPTLEDAKRMAFMQDEKENFESRDTDNYNTEFSASSETFGSEFRQTETELLEEYNGPGMNSFARNYFDNLEAEVNLKGVSVTLPHHLPPRPLTTSRRSEGRTSVLNTTETRDRDDEIDGYKLGFDLYDSKKIEGGKYLK